MIINHNNNSNYVMTKLITLKVSIFYYLACDENESACSKKKKLSFLIKIPNLNFYWNQNGKSIFPNYIDHFGRQKKGQQHRNREKPRKK